MKKPAATDKSVQVAPIATKGSAIASAVVTANARAELNVNGWYCYGLISVYMLCVPTHLALVCNKCLAWFYDCIVFPFHRITQK